MNSKKKEARIAGIWYLLMGIVGAFGIMYVPLNIIIDGDAATTAQNIIDSEVLYRLSMVSNLIGQVCFIFLVLALNRLFIGINPKLSKLMVTMVTVAVPIAFLNTLNLVAAQLLVSGVDYLNAFESNQLNSLAMGFLGLYKHGIIIVQVFWGLWLLPFGRLIIQSKFIPKIIGVLLIIGCFAYLLDSLIGFMLPQYTEIASTILMLPLAIGEFSIIFWLLIKGSKTN